MSASDTDTPLYASSMRAAAILQVNALFCNNIGTGRATCSSEVVNATNSSLSEGNPYGLSIPAKNFRVYLVVDARGLSGVNENILPETSIFPETFGAISKEDVTESFLTS